MTPDQMLDENETFRAERETPRPSTPATIPSSPASALDSDHVVSSALIAALTPSQRRALIEDLRPVVDDDSAKEKPAPDEAALAAYRAVYEAADADFSAKTAALSESYQRLKALADSAPDMLEDDEADEAEPEPEAEEKPLPMLADTYLGEIGYERNAWVMYGLLIQSGMLPAPALFEMVPDGSQCIDLWEHLQYSIGQLSGALRIIDGE